MTRTNVARTFSGVVKVIDGRLDLDSDKVRWAIDGQDYVQLSIHPLGHKPSDRQNRMFHGLLSLWWRSRLSSYDTYDEMRTSIKARYGVIRYLLVQGDKWRPLAISEPAERYKGQVVPWLVSWSEYTRDQRRKVIDGLIADMEASGILSLSASYRDEFISMTSGGGPDEAASSRQFLARWSKVRG